MDLYLFAKLGHYVAIALGVGGAIASDTLFLQAIKNKRISGDELALLKKVSSLVWIGLFLFLISGLMFIYVQYAKTGVVSYFVSEPFRAKLVIFAILFINAFVFHAKVFPKLAKANTATAFKTSLSSHALLFSVVGSISIVSWMSAFVLGSLRSITPKYVSFEDVLFIYGSLLTFAIIISYTTLIKLTK